MGYVFPPAVEAGKATDVQLGGYDFTTDMEWFLFEDHLKPEHRVKLLVLGPPGDYQITPPPYWVGPRAMSTPIPIPREVPAKLEVPRETPAGLVRWQVANANGSSGMAVFYVSRGREIIEARSRDLPQRLPALPVAVSGRLSRLAEVDRYEIVAEKDGLISIDLMNRRLGSDFSGVLQVRDAGNSLLTDMADTQGLDGGVTFSAKAGATYTISLNDVDHRGDRSYVYRLALSAGPRVLCTVPAAGQRGTSREVQFIGIGVATGKPVLESIRQAVAFPADPLTIAHTHSLTTPHGNIDVTIPLSSLIESVREGTATDSARSEGPITITAPAALTSALAIDEDEHRYTWNVKKGESWAIALQSRAVGGRLDAALTVLGPDGKLVAENDDMPPVAGIPVVPGASTTDAGLEFRAAVDGLHTCIVRSMASRTGAADEVYRLVVQPAAPDFSLDLPQQITLPLGGKVEVPIVASRTGGFDGEISITFDGLPEGVTATAPLVIAAGKKEVKITLASAADAAVVARKIQVRGSARLGETTVTRDAAAPATGNLCPRSPAEAKESHALLAMTMAAPFEVQIIDRERQREVNRGTTYLADFDIVRTAGFTGDIHIEMTAAQARYRHGMRGPVITVPAGATHGAYPIFLPEWLPTDVTQRMNVHGVAMVADPKGKPRLLTKAADARITMIMEGALLKLTSPAKELAVQAGESFEVPVHLLQSAKLPLAVTVELTVPDELKGLLTAQPLKVVPGATGIEQGVVRIASVKNARLQGNWSLTLTATALEDGKWPVISQVEVPVVFTAR